MARRSLLSGTALGSNTIDTRLLGVLEGDTEKQKDIVRGIYSAPAALTFSQVAEILGALEKNGLKLDAEKLAGFGRSPLSQAAFYDTVREDANALLEQLQRLRAQAKKERGFLQVCFNIFSREKPLEKIVEEVTSFDVYCRANDITFDAVRRKLVTAPQPKRETVWEKVKRQRFVLAAAGGVLLGLAGINLGLLPVLGLAPAVFFGTMPWLAAPFIGLSVFRAFSQYSVLKEAPTLARFAAITAAGFAISIGITSVMGGIIPPVDLSAVQAVTGGAGGASGFNPMQYMLPIIGAFTLAAMAYKRAQAVLSPGFNAISEKTDARAKLSNAYNKAVGAVMNRHTAPAIKWAGQMGEKAADGINWLFPRFIDIVGVPAVATILSSTMATGGLGLLGVFAGYYLTAFAGLVVGGAALLAAYHFCGCRGKDYREIAHAAMRGFTISSSSATMPTEKECLKNMGISKKTRESVVPLGGVFNMYGTSLYLGLTAFYASALFGVPPSLTNYLMTAGTVFGIALGAPGIPASNITLLDPVLQQTGLATGQIHKVYAMVLPADRILDMTQTAENVMGDMFAAVHADRDKLRYVRVKHINQIREKRRKDAALSAPSPA